MRISRRDFACGLTGIAIASAAVTQPKVEIYEHRVYATNSALPALETLRRNGIHPARVKPVSDGTAYLIPFASLEARSRAWDRFSTDEDWCAIRSNAVVREIRVYPAGKIFEMSL